MPYIFIAVHAHATLGEIADVSREVFGVCREPMNTKHIDREAIRQAIAEEAAHWDQTDTSDLMEQGTEWLTLEWTPRDDRCERCGAKMELRQIDLHLSDGRVTLHRVGWYTCHTPGCGQAQLAPSMVTLADQIESLVKQTLTTNTPKSVQVPAPVRESRAVYAKQPSPSPRKRK